MGATGQLAKYRGGILIKCMVLLTAFLASVALVWMLAFPYATSTWLRNRTGFDLKVESLMVNPITGKLSARGVVINNPPTFPQPDFLRVREFAVDAEAWSMMTAKPVINLVKLDVEQVTLVKRADGRINAEVMRSYLADPAARPVPGNTTHGREFLVRKLEVKFDRLQVVNYTGSKPVISNIQLNLDRSFSNVTDRQQLLLPASLDQVFDLGGAVGGLLPEDIGRMLDSALRSGTDLLKQASPAGKVFDGFSDTLEESKKP
jgi:hypothetical protein